MTVLRNVIEDAYEHLHQHNLVTSQYQFSKDWLKMSKSYYGYLKSSGADTTPHVALSLWAACRRQKNYWQTAAVENTGSHLVKEAFERMSSHTGYVENFVSEAVMDKYIKLEPS